MIYKFITQRYIILWTIK